MIEFNRISPIERKFVSKNRKWIIAERMDDFVGSRFSAKAEDDYPGCPMGFGDTMKDACRNLIACLDADIQALTELKAQAEADFGSEGEEHE